MSEHRIAWTLHNFEMEQTIIRLRNTRNRLLDRNNRKFPGAEAIETYRNEIRRLERELEIIRIRVIDREEKIEQYENNYSRLERELNDQKAKVRNLTAWLYDIYELGADSMSVGLAVNALNGEQHDETKPTET